MGWMVMVMSIHELWMTIFPLIVRAFRAAIRWGWEPHQPVGVWLDNQIWPCLYGFSNGEIQPPTRLDVLHVWMICFRSFRPLWRYVGCMPEPVHIWCLSWELVCFVANGWCRYFPELLLNNRAYSTQQLLYPFLGYQLKTFQFPGIY